MSPHTNHGGSHIPFRAVFVVLALLAGLNAAHAANAEPFVSRYVSLRAAEVNLRVGPGDQYPIAWVYRRPGLPLEVIAEFDVWRRVRDWQGEEGWIHANMLSTQRTVIIVDGAQPLRQKPDGNSPAVARADNGVVARLLRCPKGSGWCRVEVDGLRGWTLRPHIWGVHQGEVYD